MAAIELKLYQRTNKNNTSNISNQISMFLTSKIEKKIKTSYTTTTTTTTVQHQSNNKAPSFNWDRLLSYIIIKSMEEYHNCYQQQYYNNNKEYQYHNQYLEQQQSISLLTTTTTTILIPTTNNIKNEYKKYNKKKIFIYKKNQQEALLSSYLLSLEKFESFQKIYKFILPSSLSIIETVTSVILTSISLTSLLSSSTSSSIIISSKILSGKRILKNSMTTPTTVIINIIKFQNNNNILLNENNILTNIDDIQMTSNLVNIINININDITNKYKCYNYNKINTNTNIKYINTNRNNNNNTGIVINILIKYYNSDDSDVSDCKFINISNDICNNYNNNNIIKNYLNNYHSYKIINFCSLNNLFFIKYIIIKLINLNNIILKIITKQITEQINNNDTINNDTGSDVTVIIKNKNSVTTNENTILNSAMQILIKNINALNANTDTEDSNLKINNTIKSNNNNIIINNNINNNNNEYIKNVIKFPVNFSKLNPNSNNSPNNNNNNINNLVMKNNLINIHKINNNIKMENSIKNTTILPTRLKFNNNNNNYIDNNNIKTNEINNIDSSINNIKNINNNINYNINYKYKLINSKFGWCCWHKLNYIFSIFLLILIGLSSKCLAARNDVGKECTFPALWEGSWFLSGSQQSVHIKGSQFSYRGKCKAVDGNKYLIVNNNTGCHRCLVIYEKHKNVLQYKESECEGDSMYMDQSINPAAMPMRTIVKSSDNSQHSHLLNIRGREAHPTSYGHSQFSSSDRYIMRSNDDNNDCFCRGREILRNLCDQIPGDAQLYSLFREQAEPVKCPLRGPFTFTYNRGHGECKNPVSNIESCTDESRLLLNFQACPDVQGTESAAEELTCLATWKDGNSRYLVGLVTHHHAISNEERYRCFVYEKISTMMGVLGGGLGSSNLKDAEYKLAQSGDATCNGLDSAEVGSRIMTLRKPPPAERCDFPTWFKGPRHWHGLMGKSQYTYHQSEGSLIIKRFNSNYETRAFCEQINKQTSSEMIAVVHHTTGCQSGFMCMMFYRRDTHIAEIQLGAPANRLEDACAPDHFDITKLPYITLLSNEPTDHTCPLEGLYKLHGAIGPPHKISRHKRNHNNKGHNQHNHHHNIQLFQQQQQELIQQQQHAFVYSHNKRNVEHELSSASLLLSTSLSGSGIPSSSSSSILPSSSGKSTAMSSGIKRHGTFIFENSDETTQQSLESPQLPPEPPLVLAIADSGILSSSQSSSSSSASALSPSSSVSSTSSSYNQHFVKNNNNNNNNIKNNNNENGIEINENSNGMDDDIRNYRQMYNTKASNIRNRRETNLFNRIDSIDHLQILTSENTAASSSSSSTSFHSIANDNDDIDNGHANLYSSDTDDVLSILKINQTKTGIPSHQETIITNLNANSNLYQQQQQQKQQQQQQQQHNKKELRFNKKLIKDIIQMQKSLKIMSSQQQQQQQQQQKQKSRRHEIENLSPLSSSNVQLSLQSISKLAPPPSTNLQLSSLSNGSSNKNNNYDNIYNVNNKNNNNKSNDNNQLIVKINNEQQHQSRIEILNQRSRRDTPGCIVNYKEQRYFTIGCNDDKNVIEVETKQPCDLEGDEVYYCHGHWSENGTIYVIAKNSATSHAVCITYQPQDGISGILGETKLMIVGDSCIRGQMKPPEHHLVATIKRAGKCGDPSSSTIHSTNLLLFIITVGCTILFTNR